MRPPRNQSQECPALDTPYQVRMASGLSLGSPCACKRVRRRDSDPGWGGANHRRSLCGALATPRLFAPGSEGASPAQPRSTCDQQPSPPSPYHEAYIREALNLASRTEPSRSSSSHSPLSAAVSPRSSEGLPMPPGRASLAPLPVGPQCSPGCFAPDLSDAQGYLQTRTRTLPPRAGLSRWSPTL